MPKQSLRQLLREADAKPRASDPVQLATNVRHRHVHQRRVRMGTGIAVVVAVTIVSLALILPPQEQQYVALKPGTPETIDPKTELARLKIDARVSELTAAALTLKGRARRATARVEAQEDPLAQVRFQRDRAAMTMVYEAQRSSRVPALSDRAVAQYRKVIELFPGSSWAEVARDRLREMQS